MLRIITSELKHYVQRSICSKLEHQYLRSLQSHVRYASTKDDDIVLEEFPIKSIRNFSIIAHVDHGKSTLADRILEFTGAIDKDIVNKQVLDTLKVEKDRGITIKAQSASIIFRHNDQKYLLNLIDTPGHVDFAYEVSKSLAACNGVLLVIDASQGVQAQTIANFYQAFMKDLVIIPIINKIDMKAADVEMVKDQILTLFDLDPDEAIKVSAKLGTGIQEVLEAVVDRIPHPEQNDEKEFRALIYDSWFQKNKGVFAQILVKSGQLNVGDAIEACHSKKVYETRSVSLLTPAIKPVTTLYPGQVGVITAAIKNVSDVQTGDTLRKKGSNLEPLMRFEPIKPMVYAGVYPFEPNEYTQLDAAIGRLVLNDSSVTVEKESSDALGLGWRLGFLGLLHMDVFNQRLETEYDAQVIMTTPSVTYKVILRSKKKIKENGSEVMFVKNPSAWPDYGDIAESFEPMVKATIVTPGEYLDKVVDLCDLRRGIQINITYTNERQKVLTYKIPLSEVVIDFFDVLKALTSGHASFDYEDIGYTASDLVKMDIKLNGIVVHEFASIVPRERAREVGLRVCAKLKENLPQQMFVVPIQAVLGEKVIARENIKAFRKNVTAKCYGGDVTRKMKLLSRQAEGKRRLKAIANIQIPRETFIDVLRR